MLKEIEVLLPLQEIDKQIYSLRNQLKDFEPLYQRLDQQIAQVKGRLNDASKTLESLKISHKELELELGKKESDLKKFQSQLFQVKTNKEYAALQDEIKKTKEEISALEDKILSLLDKIEQEEKKLKELQQQTASEIKKIEGEKANKKAEESKIRETLKGLEERRSSLAKNIDPKMLQHYEKILEHRGGVAVCKVDKRGICTGCFLSLPPQVVNELIIGKKLIHCESCGCILYYSED